MPYYNDVSLLEIKRRISLLETIDASLLECCILEHSWKTGYEFLFLLEHVESCLTVVCSREIVESYASDLISMVEEITENKYAEEEKSALLDYFYFSFNEKFLSDDERITYIVEFIDNYSFALGSMGWFVCETMKRYLSSLLLCKNNYKEMLKGIIQELVSTDSDYKSLYNEIHTR